MLFHKTRKKSIRDNYYFAICITVAPVFSSAVDRGGSVHRSHTCLEKGDPRAASMMAATEAQQLAATVTIYL